MNGVYIGPKVHARRATIVIALACALVPGALRPSADVAKTLSFYHTHTGARLQVTYAHGAEYDVEALKVVSRYLGDFRNGEALPIDPALFDLLFDLRARLGSSGTYEVVSAYRSPATNDMLRKASDGVASKSQHLQGKAIDVRLDDVELADLHKTALAMKRGGVGYYPRSDFIHVDTGRVRRW